MKIADLVRAAQAYDLKHRPRGRPWTRVPDSQVARLLQGAREAQQYQDKQRQAPLTSASE